MLRNRSCTRAFSLAARLCCSEDVAWSHGTPAAVHLLQLIQQKHIWMSTLQPSSSSTTLQCHSNAAQQHHTQPPVPVRRLWPTALAWNELATFRTYATSSNSSGSGGAKGETSQTAASARPRDLALVFTCAKCDTRAVKAFTRQAYEQGLVLITCPGCKSMHLIADHLGWFGDSGFKIDEYLASQGQQVKRVNLAQLDEQPAQVTAADMAGWSKVQQLLSTVAGASADTAQHSESSGGCCGSSGHEHTSTHRTQQSSQSPGSTEAAAAASDASSGSSEASTTDGSMDDGANNGMLQEAHSGVVEVAPSDVEAWVRVQQQKQHGEGR